MLFRVTENKIQARRRESIIMLHGPVYEKYILGKVIIIYKMADILYLSVITHQHKIFSAFQWHFEKSKYLFIF